MFIPVGKANEDQWIYLVDKNEKGEIKEQKIMGVSYVPLTDVKTQLNRY